MSTTRLEVAPHVTFTLPDTTTQFDTSEPVTPPPIKQHGFEIKAHVQTLHTQRIESKRATLRGTDLYEDDFQHLEGPPASLSTGFKGLFDLCNASSYDPPSADPPRAAAARIEVVGTAHVTPGVKRLVKSVERGLLACQEPEAAEQGLGGTYFFCNEAGRKVAIVKPCDEEPLAPNNPKGFVGRQLGDLGLKPTVRVGEAAMREVAAYLLDHDHFAKVPHTAFVRVAHPIFHVAQRLDSSDGAELPLKLGSMQEFVSHDCDTSELGPSRFATRDVHRIGLLDIRLFNTDRHAGNMLVRKPRAGSSVNLNALTRLVDAQYELVPIDHGFCLPEALEAPYFEWLYWPQAMIPFNEEELEYIKGLDPAADVELLRRHLPMLPIGCLRTLEVATVLLKRCAAAGLSLSEIGCVCTRSMSGVDEEPSELERLCDAARAVVEATDLEEEDEEPDSAASDIAAAVMPLRGKGGYVSGLIPQELVFELEDDDGHRAGGGVLPATMGGFAGAQSPSSSTDTTGGAPSSSPFDSVGTGLLAGLSIDAALSPADSLVVRPRRESTDVPRAPVLAKSFHPSRTAYGSLAPAAALRRGRRRSHSHKRGRAKYPPLVRGAAPDSVNSVFEGLDEEDWADFMDAFADAVDDALAQGVWKTVNSMPAKAGPMSVPF